MRKNRGFTLIELIITVVIIGILAMVTVASYIYMVDRAKSTEAVVNVSAIRTAENIHKLHTGSYVAANSADEINKALSLDIEAQYYEYRVVGVTDDNFIVIAQRIGYDVLTDSLPIALGIIAYDKTGPVANGFGDYGTGGTAGGTGGTGSGTGSGTGGDTSGGDSGTSTGTTGGFGTGGSSGSGGAGVGGVGGGGGGGGSSGGGGGGTTGGGTTGGGGGASSESNDDLYDSSNLQTDLDLLKTVPASAGLIGFNSGQNLYDFITDNNIQIVWYYTGAGIGAFWRNKTFNTIYINDTYTQKSPAAIAAIIAHEATHANYEYFNAKWLGITQGENPEVLAISDNSIDQEYHCFQNQLEVWSSIKGSAINNNCDGWAEVYGQGEEHMKDELNKPEYYGPNGDDPGLPQYLIERRSTA